MVFENADYVVSRICSAVVMGACRSDSRPKHRGRSLFAMSAEFLIAGEYQREGVALAQPKFLVMPVRPELVDGTIVQPNDELFAVRRGGADGCGRAASRGLRGVGDGRFVARH